LLDSDELCRWNGRIIRPRDEVLNFSFPSYWAKLVKSYSSAGRGGKRSFELNVKSGKLRVRPKLPKDSSNDRFDPSKSLIVKLSRDILPDASLFSLVRRPKALMSESVKSFPTDMVSGKSWL